MARASNWTDAARLLARHPRATLFVTGHSMRWLKKALRARLLPGATPNPELDELQALIDEAHGHGLRVIVELVHTHASANTAVWRAPVG